MNSLASATRKARSFLSIRRRSFTFSRLIRSSRRDLDRFLKRTPQVDVQFAVTTITIAEVLTGPMKAGDEALARRYRAILETWRPIALDVDIAESAARLRATLRLGLADAVQAASALAVNAAALVTHDRDFSRVRSLRVLS